MRVGENEPWYAYDRVICQVELQLNGVQDRTLRSAGHELLAMSRATLKTASPKNLRVEIESTSRWRRTLQSLANHGHDEAVLWFEELWATAGD